MIFEKEYQYLNLLDKIISTGDSRLDRTGVGTSSIFGHEMRFDLKEGFPLFTTKKVLWKTAFKEILWMLSGSTSLRDLLKQNVRIWTDWPLKKYREDTGFYISQDSFERLILSDDAFNAKWGDLGPVYGKQWRRWLTPEGKEIDQVKTVIDLLINNPSSRRILWDGWNVSDLDKMALPPCHKHYQFFVNQKEKTLNAAMVQRSVDCFLGLPFNIANLALITHMLAKHTKYNVGEIIWYGMDCHVYNNAIEAVKEQLKRSPKDIPSLIIKNTHENFFDYKIEDFEITGYDPHPFIKADVAV